MTNDALKMPDEIYLLHNEGDMGEHLWCENIPNDEMEFTKYIRADRAALVPVDVEGLKKSYPMKGTNQAWLEGYNQAIDDIKAILVADIGGK